MSSNRHYTEFQLFVLVYLTTEEQSQEERGEAFGRPNPGNLPLKFRCVTTINELSLKIPPSSIPNQSSGKEILGSIQAEINLLKTDQLLANDPQFSDNSEPADQGFYITAQGRLFTRKHYHGLISLVENKSKYNQIIDELEGTSASKIYLRKLRDKLVKKSEDKIVEAIVSESIRSGKEYGPILIKFVVALLQSWQHNLVHDG